jgi:hypothetical protein
MRKYCLCFEMAKLNSENQKNKEIKVLHLRLTPVLHFFRFEKIRAKTKNFFPSNFFVGQIARVDSTIFHARVKVKGGGQQGFSSNVLVTVLQCYIYIRLISLYLRDRDTKIRLAYNEFEYKKTKDTYK